MKENEISNEEEKISAISHKNNAIQRLDISINKHIELTEYKMSHLLSYWITDFAEYHDNEKNFDSTSLKTFKRGDIIKANLGFNIGNELGGLHYCVVINKNDNPYSNTLNIVPLSSIKQGKKYNKNTCINLGNELFNLLIIKSAKEAEDIADKVEKLTKGLNSEITQSDINVLLERLEHLKRNQEEISRMKTGSIAYVHQITTISKQRIFKTPILSGIKLSDDSLDLIDKKIVQLFTK